MGCYVSRHVDVALDYFAKHNDQTAAAACYVIIFKVRQRLRSAQRRPLRSAQWRVLCGQCKGVLCGQRKGVLCGQRNDVLYGQRNGVLWGLVRPVRVGRWVELELVTTSRVRSFQMLANIFLKVFRLYCPLLANDTRLRRINGTVWWQSDAGDNKGKEVGWEEERRTQLDFVWLDYPAVPSAISLFIQHMLRSAATLKLYCSYVL